MKILIFMTQFYQLGGAERLGVELAEELNKRGIHADILNMYSKDLAGAAEGKKMLYDRGIPAVHSLDMRVHPSVASSAFAALKLRKLIRRGRYDVVETSMASPTLMAAWGLLGMHVRLVVGLHSAFGAMQFGAATGSLVRLSFKANRRIRSYAISNYVARHWCQLMGLSPERVRTVYNGIADSFFEVSVDRDGLRQELGFPFGCRIALFVGRLLAFKGIDTVLDGLGPVLDEEELYILFVGEPDRQTESFFATDTGLIDRLHAQIDREGWADRVRFLGRRNDVPRLMASSDVLVHPARIEGFGLVLVEAMAAGLPVVASNVDGIPEVLSGTDSLMVQPDDPKALRKAVLKTLNRPSEDAAQAVEKGRNRAEDFRIERRTDAMIKLFEDVLKGCF